MQRKVILVSHKCAKCHRLIRAGAEVKYQGKINEEGHYVHEYQHLHCLGHLYDGAGQKTQYVPSLPFYGYTRI